MALNYRLILFVYFPIIGLLAISKIKDQCVVPDKFGLIQSFRVTPPIVVLLVAYSTFVLKSIWYYSGSSVFIYNTNSEQMFYLVAYIVEFAIIILLLRNIYKIKLKVMYGVTGSGLKVTCKICTMFGLIYLLGIVIFGIHVDNTTDTTNLGHHIISLEPVIVLLVALITLVVAPVIEELLFRGLFYVPLYKKLGKWPSIVIISFLWAHIHFYDFIPSANIFVCGIALGWLYDYTGSLIYPTVLHVFFNALSFISNNFLRFLI